MTMELPSIDLGNLDMKLKLGRFMLNVHYVRFGYFHQDMPEHSHSSSSYELHFIPKGRGTLIVRNKRYPITPGTIYMTGPHIPHEQLTDIRHPMAEYCVFFELINTDSTVLLDQSHNAEETLLIERMLMLPFWFGEDRSGLLLLFQLLAKESNDQELGYSGCAARLLEMILIQFLRHYEEIDPQTRAIPTRTLDDSRLLMIENAFLYRYASITLNQLASELGLSARQTERAVSKQYGRSFNEKKTEARMAAASRLLTTTDLSIGAIAEQLGFASPEGFASAFKKQYNMSASAFRRSSVCTDYI